MQGAELQGCCANKGAGLVCAVISEVNLLDHGLLGERGWADGALVAVGW